MKKLLLILVLLLVSIISYGQIATRTSLKCQIYASSGTSPTFNIQSLVSDDLSKFDASDVVVGDKLFIIDGNECYELHIDSILLGSGSILNFRVIDSSATLSTIANGQGAIISQYTTRQVSFIPSGLRSDLASCILQKIASTVNSLSGGSTSFECQSTITKNGHGFSVGDVLYFDGTNYMLFDDYNDTPVGVVIDSVSANSFTMAFCGIVNTDFGLVDGLYFATNTGLSLNPDTIEHPILKVFGSISTIINTSGFDNDLTNVPIFTITDADSIVQIKGGDNYNIIADKIPVDIVISDTTATNVEEALHLLNNKAEGKDSLKNLLDVNLSGLLNNDVLQYDSINNRWVRYNLNYQNGGSSLLLGVGTPNLGSRTSILGIGHNSLSQFSVSGTGAFSIGTNALEVFNTTPNLLNTSTPFAIGHNALKAFVGTGSDLSQFAVGNNALLKTIGNGNAPNWVAGNRCGMEITTGWGNMIAGHNIGNTITTTAGNTIFGMRGYGSAGSMSGLTSFGFTHYYAGTTPTNVNYLTSIGTEAVSVTTDISYGVNVGAFNTMSGNNQTIVGVGNNDLAAPSNNFQTFIGNRNINTSNSSIWTLKYNTGRQTILGSRNGYNGYSANSILIGDRNLYYGTSNYSIFVGHQADATVPAMSLVNNIRGDSALIIGHYTANVPLDSATLRNLSGFDHVTRLVSFPGHGYTNDTYIKLRTYCSSCPTGITNNTDVSYIVTNSNTLKMANNPSSSGDGNLTVMAYKRVNNAIVIGHNVVPEERKIKVGNTAHTNLVVNKYNFKINQTLGSGNDGQAVRYNHSSGELEVSADNLTFGTTETTTDTNGDVVITHNLGNTPTSVQVTITGTTPRFTTIVAKSPTTFTVRIFDVVGAALNEGAVSFDWLVKK